jgi:hypothetical protein
MPSTQAYQAAVGMAGVRLTQAVQRGCRRRVLGDLVIASETFYPAAGTIRQHTEQG